MIAITFGAALPVGGVAPASLAGAFLAVARRLRAGERAASRAVDDGAAAGRRDAERVLLGADPVRAVPQRLRADVSRAALADGRSRRRELRADPRRAAVRRRRVRRVRVAGAAAESAEPRRRGGRDARRRTSCARSASRSSARRSRPARPCRSAARSASSASSCRIWCGCVVGADHRLVLPASTFFGAAFLVACDALARTVLAPLELPVGIITAVIGGPFFLWLLMRQPMTRRTWIRSGRRWARLRCGSRWRCGTAARRPRHQTSAPAPAPHRIISLVPAVTEMLFAIGAGDEVVGVSSYDTYPAGGRDEAAGSARWSIRISSAFSRCKPDLVDRLRHAERSRSARLEPRAACPIFSYEHAGLADITDDDPRAGRADRPRATRRGAMADRIERDLADVRQRVAGQPRPRTALIFGREPGSAARHLRERRRSASCTTCSTSPAAPTSFADVQAPEPAGLGRSAARARARGHSGAATGRRLVRGAPRPRTRCVEDAARRSPPSATAGCTSSPTSASSSPALASSKASG